MSKTDNITEKKEIATAYIIQKGIFRKVPLYDFPDLKIIDEVLKPSNNKEKKNLNRFLK